MPSIIGTHAVEAKGEIADLRLARGVDQLAFALGQGRGHEEIFRRAHGHLGKHDAPAGETLGRAGEHVTLGQLDLGAQLAQALKVNVDRPGADGAAARQGHLGPPIAGDQRTQHQDRGPHLAHQVVRRPRLEDPTGAQLQHPPVMAAIGGLAVEMDLDAELGEQIGHGGDVGHMGQVAQGQRLVGQEGCGHERQGRVLGPANGNVAFEATAAANAYSVHASPDATPRGSAAGSLLSGST